MRYSALFGKTKKEAPKDEVSTNAKLLMRGGFIDKLMAGSFTLLPLGFRVKEKIENIIREEINKTGASELLMPLLHPKAIWNETGRWDKAKEVMYQFKKGDKEFALSFTHEEIVLDLARKYISSYKDLPIKVYHFSTKFRDEPRAKSGILRGREFIMKDLYSLHENAVDLDKYYLEIIDVYKKIFKRLNLEAKVSEAPGGVFTDNITHEFQVVCEMGEDTILYCVSCDFAQNKEIATAGEGSKCPKCKKGIMKLGKSIEAGNIFKFGTSYSEKMNVFCVDKNSQKQFLHFASYGIGVTRLIGILVEMFNDEKGIIWPKEVAPFDIHLVGLNKKADEVYQKLLEQEIEVLYDDREGISAGEKFADCDLIGIPVRLVVSDKTGEKVEFKLRDKDETELLSPEEVIKRV
jgi:prolyl-tRNA synthetase